ncbi:replicative DNA helicase [Lederbergia lenta]|uniref:replicative DNA helicase n=1 Tax=Lederbergia lenta TaxID=1467 RepID=UPI00204074D8|nr:DnaB-like helicase C-terminal domain-containing protein [Lederbergia lenta]MCM3111649.1 DNA helicase [Lederbergia lenta]
MNAEKALLGTILKENYLIGDTDIKADQLADMRHRQLFKHMKDLHSSGKHIDIITLSTTLDIEPFGGLSYLKEIESYANVQKFEAYEELISSAWKDREKQNILVKANEEGWEIGKVITSLDEINDVKVDDHTSISDAMAKVYETPWRKAEVSRGVTTGIKQLDQMTGGHQDGELTIVAARPSMGKTDIMLHFAKVAGWQGSLPIIFSLEMPEERLTDRLIASTGRINRMKLRDPYDSLSDKQKNMWPHIIGEVSKTTIQIFDAAGQSVSEMRAKSRKLIHQYPDKKPVIIIDYLGLIRSEHFYGGNPTLQISEISQSLKNMAKEFKCPVIVLAQLNRSVEQRQDKRPMLSDIRDSGSVEQDADAVMFLYREKYYDKTSDNNNLEIIVAKQRNGPVGTVLTRYNEYTGEILDDYSQAAI